MSSPSGPTQISNMLVLTLLLVIWHIGPPNILWHECLNLQKSSSNVSLVFHLGAMGGVMSVRLNELYSLTMLTLAGSPTLEPAGAGGTPVGGGGGGGATASPPIAPCYGIMPASTSCS